MAEVLTLESSPLSYRIIAQEDIDQLYAIYPDLPKNSSFGCPSCGKNDGQMVNGHVMLNGVTYRCNCQDQLQRYKHYLNAGIGLTYQTLDWTDYHGDRKAFNSVMDYRSNLATMIDSGKGISFLGNYGVGKSMLAYLLLKDCVMAGYRCYATTFADMLASMKSGWKDADFAKWYKGKVDSAQVLLVDDLGKEMLDGNGFNNDFAKQTFDSLIRTRAQQSRPVIITSNLNVAGIKTQYGEAVYSLMQETSTPIIVDGSDYRRNTIGLGKGYRRIY